MSREYVIISTTAANDAEAEDLAKGLAGGRLAACVQSMPIKSTYRWKGAIESATEILLLIKTRAALQNDVIAYIKDRHSYDIPEIIVTEAVGGEPQYLAWIEEETSK